MTIKSSPSFHLERDFSYWQILSLVCSLKYYVHIFVIFSGGLAKIFEQGVSTRAKTLRITFLTASRYIKRETSHFRLITQRDGRKKRMETVAKTSLGTLRRHDGDDNENVKKAIGWMGKTTTLCTCVTHFCKFLCRHCTTVTVKCLISRFMEDVSKRLINFLSLSELEYGS